MTLVNNPKITMGKITPAYNLDSRSVNGSLKNIVLLFDQSCQKKSSNKHKKAQKKTFKY